MYLAQVQINSTSFAPAKFANIGVLLNIVLPLAMAGAALLFLIMVLYGVYNYMTHGDNPEMIKKSYSTMIFAVVGLLIIIASFLAVRLIGLTTGGTGSPIP